MLRSRNHYGIVIKLQSSRRDISAAEQIMLTLSTASYRE